MADAPIDERAFSDDEVREILKRAVKAPSTSVSRRDGITLAELQAIGREVGIDPLRVERAAREVTAGRSTRITGLLGSPLELEATRRVPGALDPDDTAEVLATVRRVMGRQGTVQELHGALEWSASTDSGERHVTISSKDGFTTVRGSANITNAAVGTFLPAGAVSTILTLALLVKFLKGGPVIGLVVCLVLLPVLYAVLRTILGRFSASTSDRLDQVVDSVAGMVSASREPQQ